ncbi:MAG: anthrone oxygenase family protein [Thermomicrobiales bacterium]
MPGSILTAAVLAGLVRRRPAFGLTLAGTGDLAAALAVWFAFVAPMNKKVATWSADSIPADWIRVRDQWEFAHAVRVVLQLSGFSMLLASVIAETPRTDTRENAS